MSRSSTIVMLSEKPRGKLAPHHFASTRIEVPTPVAGEVCVQLLYLSIDAANRAWMQGDVGYRGASHAGQKMDGYAIARVVESQSDSLRVGDIVGGDVGWCEYCTCPATKLQKLEDYQPRSYMLSVLGIAGRTAYTGLVGIGKPQANETLVVSAAAGSVGTLVGQIGVLLGMRVVGIAGTDTKCDWLCAELGFHSAINYKSGSLSKALRQHCPDGIDIYFDNVGGTVLEASLFAMKDKGRIVCCGAVSQYDTEQFTAPRGIPGLMVMKRLRMQGFVLGDDPELDRQAGVALRQWLEGGQLKVSEDIYEGLASAPDALIGLLAGNNKGKRMVHISD